MSKKCVVCPAESHSSTNSSIDEICNGCDINYCYDYRQGCNQPNIPPCNNGSQQPKKYDPGVSYFTSVITPVTGLTPQYSDCPGSVQFRMRRKNKTVTLQWENFTGTLAANGVAFLTVCQTICNTPPYAISVPIYIQYTGTNRITHITIDPNAKNGNILFYLNTDGSSNNINMGDAFTIYAAAITWIVD